MRKYYFLAEAHLSALNYKTVLAGTFLVSLALSLSQIMADGVINNDGILYLKMAHLYQQGDWIAASKLFDWPFYSYLIYTFSNLTSMPLELSAHVINSLCSAITCVTFVALVELLGGKKQTLLFAAIIILSLPKFNEYRNMVMRDHGYWAFYSLTCLFFFRLNIRPKVTDVILFALSGIVALLFRNEGLIFIILLTLFLTWRHKLALYCLIKTNLKLCGALFLAFVFALGFFSTSEIRTNLNPQLFEKLQQPTKLLQRLKKQIVAPEAPNSNMSRAKNFLNKIARHRDYSEGLAISLLAITALLILVAKSASSLGYLFFLALGFAAYRKTTFPKEALISPWFFILIGNFIILSGYILTHFFLTGRYPMPLVLTLLLILPFLVSSFFSEIRHADLSKFYRRFLILILSLFVFSTLDGLISTGAKKDHLKEAGLWVKERVAENELRPLYTNSLQVDHYAGWINKEKPKEEKLALLLNKLNAKKLNGYKYLALKTSRRDTHAQMKISEVTQQQPIKIFKNSRNDAVLIYTNINIRPQ